MKKSSFKCIYTNPDILDNKMSELSTYVQHFKPMVIGIAEVKPKHYRLPPSSTTYKINGYTQFHKNIESNTGRGVLLYVHSSLNPSDVSLYEDYEESVWAEVKLRDNDKLLIGVVYRSDSGSTANNIKLLRLMKDVSEKKYSHTLIMGDFNFSDINWSSWSTPHGEEHLESQFLECSRDTFFHQHVTKPTRYRFGQTPNALDLIFTTEEGMVSDLYYHSPLGKSDHCVLEYSFNCYLDLQPKATQHRMCYNRGEYNMMKNDLDINWEEEFKYMPDDANRQWMCFCKHLKAAEDKWIPKRNNYPSSHNKKGKLPLDAKCLRKIRKKRRAWRRFLETRDGEKWQEYCHRRNQVRALTRRVQKELEKNIAMQSKRNQKKFWR